MRSSVVDYLYPQDNRTIAPSIPKLNFPLKVAIAFVPEQAAYGRGQDFNQIQFSSQNKLSLSYWTLVGAYFIEGDENI